MIFDFFFAMRMWFRFHTYRPQSVTPRLALKWLHQFDPSDRASLRKAAYHLTFVSEKHFVKDLVDRNRELLTKLRRSGVALSHVIYVSIGDAGSSSHATLNLIRDRARLQNVGCRFADGRSYDALRELTNEVGTGVIIYVDDFAGTGEQFCLAQEQLSSYIIGNFSQYYLMHTACEEAIDKIDGIGVVPWQHAIHRKIERPLHPDSSILTTVERQCLIGLCLKVGKNKPGSLGKGNLAVSVVFYQNTPNNAPRIFRGDKQQKNFRGLVPRTTDLPKPVFG